MKKYPSKALPLFLTLLLLFGLVPSGLAGSNTPLFSFVLYQNSREINLYEDGTLQLMHLGRFGYYPIEAEYVEEIALYISQYAPEGTGDGEFYLRVAGNDYILTEEEFLDIQNNPEEEVAADLPHATVRNFAKGLWKILLRSGYESFAKDFNPVDATSPLFELHSLNGVQNIIFLNDGALHMSHDEKSKSCQLNETYANQVRTLIENTTLPEETKSTGDYMISVAGKTYYLSEAEFQDVLANFHMPVAETEDNAALRNLVKNIWSLLRDGMEEQE